MAADARKYWIEQMEAASAFMRKVLACPVRECGENLECLQSASRAAGARIVFPSPKHLGVFDRLFHVRRSLVGPVLRVAQELLRRDLVLQIEDAYRLPESQAQAARSDYVVSTAFKKVRWELGGRLPDAELVFRRLAVWSATTPIFANHTCGSAVDVSVLRPDGSTLDMGAAYPELSHRIPLDSPFIPKQARRNRHMVRDLMQQEAFAPYPYEFWHYSHGDADYEVLRSSGQPARFGPVRLLLRTGQLAPVKDILKPFVTLDDIRRRLAELGLRCRDSTGET